MRSSLQAIGRQAGVLPGMPPQAPQAAVLIDPAHLFFISRSGVYRWLLITGILILNLNGYWILIFLPGIFTLVTWSGIFGTGLCICYHWLQNSSGINPDLPERIKKDRINQISFFNNFEVDA
jgi:hypothetical protein